MEQGKLDEEMLLEHPTPDHEDFAVGADAYTTHHLPLDEAEKTTAADFEPEHVNPSEADSEDHAETMEGNSASDLDPIVLSSLVIQLRKSLEDVYKERDELREATETLTADIHVTRSSLADLEKQHVYISAAKEAVENELKVEKDKREAAEESVSLLRSRLEEARKAVTGLQTQDRRRTTLGHGSPPVGDGFVEDLASDISVAEGTDKRSKRNTGLGIASQKTHRRRSSQSDSGLESISLVINPSGPSSAVTDTRAVKMSAPPALPIRPSTGGLRELRLGAGAASSSGQGPPSPNPSVGGGLLEPVPEAKDSKRWSALSALRSSPKQPAPGALEDVEELNDSPRKSRTPPLIQRSSSGSLQDRLNATLDIDASQPPYASGEALSLLQTEVNRLRAQLAASQEARVASENAVKVLREFMSSDRAGGLGDEDREGFTSPVQGLRLPPLPTDSQDDDEEDSFMTANKDPSTRKQTGWTLRLWKDKEPSPKVASPDTTVLPSGRASAVLPLGSPMLEQESDSTPSGALSTPLASFVSSWSKGVASSPTAKDASTSSPQSTTPGRMLSFFGKATATPHQQHLLEPQDESLEDPTEESASRADPSMLAALEATKRSLSETEVVDLSDDMADAPLYATPRPDPEVNVKAEQEDDVQAEKAA